MSLGITASQSDSESTSSTYSGTPGVNQQFWRQFNALFPGSRPGQPPRGGRHTGFGGGFGGYGGAGGGAYGSPTPTPPPRPQENPNQVPMSVFTSVYQQDPEGKKAADLQRLWGEHGIDASQGWVPYDQAMAALSTGFSGASPRSLDFLADAHGAVTDWHHNVISSAETGGWTWGGEGEEADWSYTGGTDPTTGEPYPQMPTPSAALAEAYQTGTATGWSWDASQGRFVESTGQPEMVQDENGQVWYRGQPISPEQANQLFMQGPGGPQYMQDAMARIGQGVQWQSGQQAPQVLAQQIGQLGQVGYHQAGPGMQVTPEMVAALQGHEVTPEMIARLQQISPDQINRLRQIDPRMIDNIPQVSGDVVPYQDQMQAMIRDQGWLPTGLEEEWKTRIERPDRIDIGDIRHKDIDYQADERLLGSLIDSRTQYTETLIREERDEAMERFKAEMAARGISGGAALMAQEREVAKPYNDRMIANRQQVVDQSIVQFEGMRMQLAIQNRQNEIDVAKQNQNINLEQEIRNVGYLVQTAIAEAGMNQQIKGQIGVARIGAETARRGQNLGALGNMMQLVAQSDLMAQQANQGAALRVGELNQRADLTAQQLNQATELARLQSNQQAGLTAQQANQATELARLQSNQQAGLTAQQLNQATELARVLANQQAGLTAQQLNQATELSRVLANQQAALTADQSNALNDLNRQIANQQTGLAAQQTNVQSWLGVLGLDHATAMQNVQNDLALFSQLLGESQFQDRLSLDAFNVYENIKLNMLAVMGDLGRVSTGRSSSSSSSSSLGVEA